MRKVIDITEKLSFDENPRIVISGEEFEVNADAKNVLEIMGLFSTKSSGEASVEAYEKLFSKKDRDRIDKMKMKFNDFLVVVETAIGLASGEEEDQESSDPYYDLIDDFDLIVSSFQSQYGLRLSRELDSMKWDEFRDLLIGISPDTALGRVVAIRSETDKDVLKYFTKEQHRIRNEWLQKRAESIPQVSERGMWKVLEGFKQAFISMAGGVTD